MDVERIFAVERRVLVVGNLAFVVKIEAVGGFERVMPRLPAEAERDDILVRVGNRPVATTVNLI